MKLDVKIFIVTALLVPTLLVFKLCEDATFLFLWYFFFLMTSIAISGFHMTYLWSSKYNKLIKVKGNRRVITTILIYILVCIGISFIITKFELIWIFTGI